MNRSRASPNGRSVGGSGGLSGDNGATDGVVGSSVFGGDLGGFEGVMRVGSPRWLGVGPRPSIFVLGARDSGSDALADALVGLPGFCGGPIRLFDDDTRYSAGLAAATNRYVRQAGKRAAAVRNGTWPATAPNAIAGADTSGAGGGVSGGAGSSGEGGDGIRGGGGGKSRAGGGAGAGEGSPEPGAVGGVGGVLSASKRSESKRAVGVGDSACRYVTVITLRAGARARARAQAQA